MQPQNPGAPADNSAVLAAIEALKTDIVSEVDKRFVDQGAALEERFKPVDEIQQTLEAARQNQIEAQRRQQAANPQPQWVPKSWDEIPAMIQTEAARIAKETIDARDQAAQTAATRQSNEERELESQIDSQLVALERGGYLPAVGNPNDYNDPGVATRRELLAAASHMGTPELDKVALTLAELHKQNIAFNPQTKTFDNVAGSLTPLPGKFAPVGNGSARAPQSGGGPSYGDIHAARDFDSLIALAEQRGYGPVPTSTNNDTGF
jgi:hypothetical protein